MSARPEAHELSPRDCETCGAAFMPRKGSKGIYCSQRCANTGISRASLKERSDAQRDRGEGRTYRKRNGRHEHRLVAEQMLGRSLLPGEVVHHIDGGKRNNDPSNLAVMTQAEHMREHGLGIPGMPLPWKPWESRVR